jgi:hypothetical protein
MGSVEICCRKNNSVDNYSNLIKLSGAEEIMKNPSVDEGEINKTELQLKKSVSNKSEQTQKLEKENLMKDKNEVIDEANKNSLIKSPIYSKISNRKGRRSAFFNRTYLNIIIIGDKKVGKTSFSSLLSRKIFNEYYNPSFEDNEQVTVKVIHHKRTYNFTFHIINDIDLIKKNKFNFIIDYYLIFYDLSEEKTIHFCKKIYSDFLKNRYVKINEKLSNIIFIGNKCDLKKINNIPLIDYCKINGLDHFEISVKENQGISELNQKLIEVFDINMQMQNQK